jgi:nucleoside-diphosphate-sugar epimerase
MDSIITKAVVTGATGFIGRHLIERLCSIDLQINLYVGYRHSVEDNLCMRSNMRYFSLDLTSPINLNLSADIVFHLAGEKHDESKMWEVNLVGTRRLLEWSVEHEVKRFIYLSSVGVYGARKNAGVIVAGAKKCPQNTYEASKSAAEDLVREICTENGIEYVILQPTNVVGYQERGAYPLLGLMQSVQRGWFTYFGGNSTFFNYVAVEDVVNALLAATKTGAANRTFIINSPVPMQQFIGWIAEELGVPAPVRRMPVFTGIALTFLADILSLLRRKRIPFDIERLNELTNSTCYDGVPIASLDKVYLDGIEVALRKLVQLYRKNGVLQ